MRLVTRTLGWVIVLLWIVTLALPISVALSLMRLAEGKNLGVQEPTFNFFDGNISVNMPVYINNTGFYDISEPNVAIKIYKVKVNTTIVSLSKSLPSIPAGQMVNTSCSFTASLMEIFHKDRTLLTEDTNLNVNAQLSFKVAYTIAFNASLNFSTRWGAPFHNISCVLAYNDTTHVFSISISFNNHAFFPINGLLVVKLYNSDNIQIGETSIGLDVPSGGNFQETVEVAADPSKITDRGFIRLFFTELNILEMEWTLL